jgi:hypothetical protein
MKSKLSFSYSVSLTVFVVPTRRSVYPFGGARTTISAPILPPAPVLLSITNCWRWLDALFGPAAAAHDYVRSHGLKVHDVMTRDPVTVAENTPQAVRIMGAHSVKRLPVMRRGKLVASSAAPT